MKIMDFQDTENLRFSRVSRGRNKSQSIICVRCYIIKEKIIFFQENDFFKYKMANIDILSEFEPADINEFKKDFTRVINAGFEVDRLYEESRNSLDFFIPKYEKLIGRFNKKYKGIEIGTKKSIEHFKVRLFVKERSIKDFFANSASRISGIRSVGRSNFGQIDATDSERFAIFLDSLLDKIYISYADIENGTSAIAAQFDRGKKSVEIIYSHGEIINENSAGFKVCAFYALKDGYNKKIDFYNEALTFGFGGLLDEVEKRKWTDRFRQ